MKKEIIINNDEANIHSLFGQMLEGWNKGSGAKFAGPFDEESVFIAFDGSQIRGRAEIEKVHQELFDKWLKGSRLTGEITGIRFLSATSAVIHSTGSTILQGHTKPAPERDSIQTLVAVKKGDVWKFVSFHNNRVRPIRNKAANAFVWMITDWLWKPLT